VTLKTAAAVVVREERESACSSSTLRRYWSSPANELGAQVEARLFRDDDELHAPHLVDVAIVRGLRRLVRTMELASGRAEEAIAALTDLDRHRHAHLDLLGRPPSPLLGNGETSRRSAPEFTAREGGWLLRLDSNQQPSG
jgi:hypothetical protein